MQLSWEQKRFSDGDAMIDIRFPTALQMLLTLAHAERQGYGRMTSAQLANGLGSTASLVRKLLVPLGRDGLVSSTLGKTGGVQLARPARSITLREIYASVTDDKKLWAARVVPHICDVSSHVEEFFEALAEDAEASVLDVLGSRTLEQSLDELMALKQRAPGKRSRAAIAAR
jgi:Rrf2 family transcriptional repressor of oqxAB